MSLTVILASIGAPLAIIGVAFFIVILAKDLPKKLLIITAIPFAIGAAAISGAVGTYNQNIKDAEWSCTDNGGHLYKSDGYKACFVEQPEILQPV